MKNLATFFVFLLILLPIHATAQTYTQVQKESLIAVLKQLIVLLTAQIQAILAQQQVISQQQTILAQYKGTQTTPATSSPPTIPPESIQAPQASFVDLKVNGSDGPLSVEANNCIRSGVKTCVTVSLDWNSTGASVVGSMPPCSITGGGEWSGNPGSASGTRLMTVPLLESFYSQGRNAYISNIVFSCDTPDGKKIDTVQVVVDATPLKSRLKDLYNQRNGCGGGVPIADATAQCQYVEDQITSLENI